MNSLLLKTSIRTFKPPSTVFDYAFVNNKTAPTRAGTKRQNWARFGEKRSRVNIQEIVPSLQEYREEFEAEKSWWPNRKELNREVNKIAEDQIKKESSRFANAAKKLKNQKVYDKQILEAKNKQIEEEKSKRAQWQAEQTLFDALGYKPEANTEDAKLKRLKEALKEMKKGGR